jgi:hypothetical protein
MTIRSVVTVLVTTVALMASGPAAAQQAKCMAGKTKCMAKLGTGLIKCEQLAETPGKVPDPNAGGCVTKAETKFNGGIEPPKGCFEKLENKTGNDCLTTDDTGAAQGAVGSCVSSFVEAIDPAPLDQTKCGAGKKKCVAKFYKGVLKCHQLAQTPGKPNDPNAGGCLDKARAKFDGGLEPTKGCFEKLENKVPNDCQIFDDTESLQALVESCADDLAELITPPPPGGVELQGALTATPGRFNYNLTVGLPGANAACNSKLQIAEAAGDLVGLQDTASMTVTSFWAIDNSQPPLQQCQDDVSSFLNWEYATAHTPSRGQKVTLNNGTGTLGVLQSSLQCNFSTAWVGCCL